jgi:hypothetical protein
MNALKRHQADEKAVAKLRAFGGRLAIGACLVALLVGPHFIGRQSTRSDTLRSGPHAVWWAER